MEKLLKEVGNLEYQLRSTLNGEIQKLDNKIYELETTLEKNKDTVTYPQWIEMYRMVNYLITQRIHLVLASNNIDKLYESMEEK